MLSLMLILGMLFICSMQPMFMVSMLIMIVLLYSYIMYYVMGGYWFSYALVMVMLSGVLVIFMYMASLIPNESFEEYNLLYMFSLMMFIVGGKFMYLYMNKYSMMSLFLWSSYLSVFNIFLVGFLFMIMLLVVWLSYMGYGALRVFS